MVPQKNTEPCRKGDSKMKKLLTLICMLACIFGLTACGSDETLTEYEQQKVDYAEYMAVSEVIPALAEFMDDDKAESFNEYTMAEIEYVVANRYSFGTDGYAFSTAIESFHSAAKSIGEIQSIGEITSEIDDDQIIVDVTLVGTKKEAVAELIFSNDMFMTLESAALNPVSTMGELMTGAALNTLIGMGTVFVVLILISLIISGFKVISVLQNKAAEKKTQKSTVQESIGVDNAVAQIVDQEQVSGDDLELAAVIAAAIAAFEGSASTDGFVVRSIRRQRNI